MNPWLAVISLRSISLQVPRSSLCWGHLLLFRRDGVCSRRDPGTLFQDLALVLHPPDLQLRIERTAAVRSRALSATSSAKVGRRDYRSDRNPYAKQHAYPPFRLDPATGLLQPSTVVFASPPRRKTVLTLKLLAMLGLTRIIYDKDGKTIVSATNLTLYTLILVYKPMREDKLTMTIMLLQFLGSIMAFFVRYGIASLLYDGDRR